MDFKMVKKKHRLYTLNHLFRAIATIGVAIPLLALGTWVTHIISKQTDLNKNLRHQLVQNAALRVGKDWKLINQSAHAIAKNPLVFSFISHMGSEERATSINQLLARVRSELDGVAGVKCFELWDNNNDLLTSLGKCQKINPPKTIGFWIHPDMSTHFQQKIVLDDQRVASKGSPIRGWIRLVLVTDKLLAESLRDVSTPILIKVSPRYGGVDIIVSADRKLGIANF